MVSILQDDKQGVLPFVLAGIKLNSSNRLFTENERLKTQSRAVEIA